MKFFLMIFALFCAAANGSTVDSTKITNILVGPQFGNRVMLTLSNKPLDAPACQTKTHSYAFDGTTESGKMTLSVVLAAYAAKKDVTLGGNNTCDLYSGIEDLRYVFVQ